MGGGAVEMYVIANGFTFYFHLQKIIIYYFY